MCLGVYIKLYLHYCASHTSCFAREQCGFIVGLCGGRENQIGGEGGRSGREQVGKDQISSALHQLWPLLSDYFANSALSYSFETLPYQNSAQLSLGGCHVLSE